MGCEGSPPPPTPAGPRPLPGAEPFPSTLYPPSQTTPLSGAQTQQFRPNAVSDRIFNLGAITDSNHAKWTLGSTPNPQYPIVIDDGGGGTPNGTRTILLGGEIDGGWNPLTSRATFYASFDAGIEHNSNNAAGWVIADGQKVKEMPDAYRFLGQGQSFLKRLWAIDILDGMCEWDNFMGDAWVYDALIEGCYSGFSSSGPGDKSNFSLTIDGVLMHIKPTVDHAGSGWCGGTGGCAELNTVWADGRNRGSNRIWEGTPGTTEYGPSHGTINIQNSWFLMQRPPAWGTNNMVWPGQSGSDWGVNPDLNIGENVKVLWAPIDTSFNPTNAAYPGAALPAGVELVTGGKAMDMWTAARNRWLLDKGYSV